MSLRHLWDRLPFSARLMVTASVALLVAGAAMLYFSAHSDALEAREYLQGQLKAELHALPREMADLVVIGDFAALQQHLTPRTHRTDIAAIRFRDSSGAVIEAQDDSAPPTAPAWFSHWVGLTDPTGEAPVEIGGRRYGTFEIRLTAQPAVDRVWSRLLKHLAILALAVGLDFLGIWLVLRLGLRPLRMLDQASQALAAGNLAQRIPRQGSPEFQHAIVAFNRMAGRIETTITALEESEGRVSAILESIGDGLIATDTTMRISYLNPIAEVLTGWSLKEARGQPVAEVFRIEHALTHQPAEIPVGRVLESGRVVGLANHTLLIARDGRRYHIADSAAPIRREPNGEIIGVVMVFRDVTEPYRLRTALEQSQDRLGLALKGADLGLWDWRLDSGAVVFDARWAEMLGYRLAEIEPSIATWESLVHPDDLPHARQALDAHLQGLTPQYEAEHRLRTQSGEWRWVLTRGRVTERSAGGEALRVTGTHLDISERKRSEEALRLAAIAFETTEAIFITSPAGVILRANRAFSAITGYGAEEAVGRTPGQLLRSGRHNAAFYQLFWRRLRDEGSWEGEVWNRRKNGEVYPEWLSIKAARDGKGAISHYVANFTDITDSKRAQAEIERLAYFDPLTGLPNRRLLFDRLGQELASARRSGRCGALLFLDLDHFKNLNDARGHAVGDQLLEEVSHRLSHSLRGDDTVARLGGDEFVVLLSNLATTPELAAAAARDVAEKLRRALTQPFRLDGSDHHIGTSIGVTLFPEDKAGADELLRRADTAMYRAKSAGRNTVCFFEPEMQVAVERRLSLERALREALEGNEFSLHLQPQWDGAGRLVGAEALLRWQRPGHGLVSPGDFIPVAEESGLIVTIGAWVLAAGLRALKRIQEAGLDIRLAINVSPRQFHEADFVAQVVAVLAASGADPRGLVLEITEGMLMGRTAEAIGRMSQLERVGVRFSIDDFGTGYSSLAYLKQLPLGEIKIDQGFVAGLPNDRDDAALVGTILAIARNLGLGVVAEGVENQAQLDFLKAQGCDGFQGYHLGRPLPLEHFLAQFLP